MNHINSFKTFAGGMSTKAHSLNPYENISGSSMSGTPIRPKPTNELKAVSMSTLVPSPITPSPSLSLPPGMSQICCAYHN